MVPEWTTRGASGRSGSVAGRNKRAPCCLEAGFLLKGYAAIRPIYTDRILSSKFLVICWTR